MVTILRLFNDIFCDFRKAHNINIDPQLVKFFKTEYGSSWHLEMDKYLLKKESVNDKKVA